MDIYAVDSVLPGFDDQAGTAFARANSGRPRLAAPRRSGIEAPRSGRSARAASHVAGADFGHAESALGRGQGLVW